MRSIPTLKRAHGTGDMELLPDLSGGPVQPAVPAGRRAIRFDIRSYSSPAQIEREWRYLEAIGTGTVFQRYDWIEPYTRHVLPFRNARAAILLGRLNDHPAFILPLAIVRVGPARVATWIGGKHSAYNFGLWSPEAIARMKTVPRDGIVRMLGTALQDVDCAVLERMPPVHDGVAQPLAALAGGPSSGEGYPFDLTGGFDAVLAQRKGSTRKKRVRSKERRMSEVGELNYKMVQGIAEEQEALEFFFEQKALRLSEQGKPNGFDRPGVKDFYRDLLERSHGMSEPVLEIATLAVGGKIRAVTGSGVRHGRVNSYFTAFALDELAPHSPGNILTFRHIEDCCRRGMTAYDLGIGHEDYKTHWCQEILPLDDRYAAFTPLGTAIVALTRTRESAKNRIRRNRTLWNQLKAARSYVCRRLFA